MARFVPVDEPSGPPASAVFGISAIRRLADNVLALPQTVSGLLSSSLPETTVPRGLGLLHSPFTAGGEQTPVEFAIPAPTTGDIASGIRAAPQLLTDPQAFSREQERQARADVAFRESSPTAAAAGDLTGDIAGLIALRRPAARGIRSAEEALTSTQVKLPSLSKGGRLVIEKAINSPNARSLARGAGRSVETGADAAILSVLQGNDPREIAGYAAGGQLLGSAILGTPKFIFSGGPLGATTKLAVAGASAAAVIQLVKSAAPGGRDRILESIETGFDKVKWGLFLGATAGIAGAGRFRSGEVTRHFSRIADAISTVPRGSVIALANEWRSAKPEDQRKIERGLELSQNLESLGPKITRKLQRAMDDGKTSFLDTINKLSEEHKDFRKKMEGLEEEKRRARFVPVD